MREQHRVGVDYLQAATALLRRVRSAHPSAGLLEAADLQWWWRTPRSTDHLRQLFWFDDLGRPEAAVIATDWSDGIALDPVVMPDAHPDWVAHVIARGLAHASELGFENLDVVVDHADEVMCKVLSGHGFAINEQGADASSASLSVVSAWLATDTRPETTPLPKDSRFLSRRDEMQRPHHMIHRNGPGVEMRLRQTLLYRPDLDMFILDSDDCVAAYGLFWFDPETATGLVEPMRTEDSFQRRGLARHLLTAGIQLLAAAGARRIKICFSPDNPAASGLYLSIGFQPDKKTVVFSHQAGAGAA